MPRNTKASVRRVLLPVLAVIIGLNLYLVINVLRNGSALNSVNLFDIQITLIGASPRAYRKTRYLPLKRLSTSSQIMWSWMCGLQGMVSLFCFTTAA
jgi:hypothetical protein